MKNSWWPQITVDVVESDLGSFFGNRQRKPMIHEDDEIECDWDIVDFDDFSIERTKYDILR